ncbi:methyl-accepting chemotaxis protein [Aneurinibacillus soli]|uniref:Putative methyl-accepting chemotaxis protein YoaH n=1 Tax=Aneurinibacillus soli TaxID=1500254 RepID=A0A0U5B374_9BACL|nr:methyl-accepting chemotaxis protein [Aneurinibacillus soli]PYE62868.1 methyl-accepting chemotaxis protein [Aneurinibacillus soli]BAU29074.1 putative methyl-accepting chemotaxis protein YoaH [Aneurinibacillus soli]
MRIKTKLIVGISMLFIFSVSMGILAVIENKKTQVSYNNVLKNREDVRYYLKNIQYRIVGISNDERAYLLTGDNQFKDETEKKITDIKEYLSIIKGRGLNPDEREAISNLENGIHAFLAVSTVVKNTYEKDKHKALQLHLTDERDVRKKTMDPTINKAVELIDKHTAMDLDKINKSNFVTNAILRTLVPVSVIFGLIVMILLLRSIKPLELLQNEFKAIANGDLTQPLDIKSKDEIGELSRSVNAMIENLRSAISTINNSSHQVSAAAEELLTSSEHTHQATEHITITIEELASGTDKQVQSVEETSQIVDEMSSRVQQISIRTQDVSTTATHALEKAMEGNQAIQTTIQQMNSISETVEGFTQKIKELGERSNEIGEIVEVITSIAGQTNLLALNAAIEAARAGEQGKGFAVVADEVRKLAEQSAQSSEQIARLITGIQVDTNAAVISTENVTKEVEEGIHVVHITGEYFKQIENEIDQVANQIKDVSDSVRQISLGTDQVVYSINTVTGVAEVAASRTQSVSAATKEQFVSIDDIISAATSLSKMSENLQTLIERFKV